MIGQFVTMMLVITGVSLCLAALVVIGECIHQLVNDIAESNRGGAE